MPTTGTMETSSTTTLTCTNTITMIITIFMFIITIVTLSTTIPITITRRLHHLHFPLLLHTTPITIIQSPPLWPASKRGPRSSWGTWQRQQGPALKQRRPAQRRPALKQRRPAMKQRRPALKHRRRPALLFAQQRAAPVYGTGRCPIAW